MAGAILLLELSGVSDVYKAGRGAVHSVEASARAVSRRADELVQFHHAWPQYLGGSFQQILEPLPRSVHNAFHSGLDKVLPRQWGQKYYDNLSTAERRRVLKDLEEYVKQFDREYGTSLWEAMLREGFSIP